MFHLTQRPVLCKNNPPPPAPPVSTLSNTSSISSRVDPRVTYPFSWQPKGDSECDPAVRQVIPYIVYSWLPALPYASPDAPSSPIAYSPDPSPSPDPLYYVYRRKSSTTLDGSLSIGFGGHVELEDDPLVFSPKIPIGGDEADHQPWFDSQCLTYRFYDIIGHAAFREFCEETLFAPSPSLSAFDSSPSYSSPNPLIEHNRRHFLLDNVSVSWQWFKSEPYYWWCLEQWRNCLTPLKEFTTDDDAVCRAHISFPFIYQTHRPEITLDPSEAEMVGWYNQEELLFVLAFHQFKKSMPDESISSLFNAFCDQSLSVPTAFTASHYRETPPSIFDKPNFESWSQYLIPKLAEPA